MRMQKRRLSSLLATALVVSSLAQPEITASASSIEAVSQYQKKETLVRESAAIESDIVKEDVVTEMLELSASTERVADTDASGTCGENLTWNLEDGVLTIDGTGRMEDWSRLPFVPWHNNRDNIRSIEISDGVVNIGKYAFHECNSLTGIVIPDSVISITSAFGNCVSLSDVYYAGNEDDWSDIDIERSGNEFLTNATIHYHSMGPHLVATENNAVLYVPYSVTIALYGAPTGSRPVFHITEGSLPEGLQLDENTGEISGTPVKAGEFKITIEAVFSGNHVSEDLTITVKENTDINIDDSSDEGYEVERYVGTKTEQGYIITQYADQLFVSSGDFEEFIALWLNGQRLVENEDYTKEKGSTRLTILRQTFEKKARPGSNTLSAQFKTKDNQLKRTSQNFILDVPKKDDNGTSEGNSGSDSNSGGNSGSSGNGSSDGNSSSNENSNSSGNSSSGGSSGSGGSHRRSSSSSGSSTAASVPLFTNDSWVKDDIGWKCKRQDNTWLTGGWYFLPYNEVMGWYYFNEQGYMAVGWLEDQGRTYYLNPVSDGTQGKMCTAWRLIEGKWYYFNEQSDGTQGALMVDTRIGEYYVNGEGIWIE